MISRARVGDQVHLDYLYVMTVADVRRHQSEAVECLEGAAVRAVLRAYQARLAPRARDSGRSGGTDSRKRRKQARAKIAGGFRRNRSRGSGRSGPKLTFCATRPRKSPGRPHCSPTGILTNDAPLVAISTTDGSRRHCGAHLRASAPPEFLHETTAVLDQMGLNVVDARLITSANGLQPGKPTWCSRTTARSSPTRRAIREIEQGLWRNLQQPEDAPATVDAPAPPRARCACSRRRPRSISASTAATGRTISRTHRRGPPGIASPKSARVFRTERVAINGAKIMTVGERARGTCSTSPTPKAVSCRKRRGQRLQESLVSGRWIGADGGAVNRIATGS